MSLPLFKRRTSVSRATKLPLVFALLLCAPLAAAQKNLGELLDAGGKIMSAEDFKREVVQRTIFGPTATGGNIEVMYALNGSIAGTGSPLQAPGVPFGSSYQPVSGEWRIESDGRICTAMRITSSYGQVALPPRCQAWFKYGDDYFIADSESDRSVRVLRRTPKP